MLETYQVAFHIKNYHFIVYLLEDEQELSLGMLIRLRPIYNFLLFHANIIQLSHILVTFYMIYWTNLLIQCPVIVPVFVCFLCRRKSVSNKVQMR